MSKKPLVLKSCIAIVLLITLIFVYVPQSIYFGQREYFGDYFLNLVIPNFDVAFIFGSIILIILVLLPTRLLKYLSSIMLLTGISIWLYADFFTVSYGVLDGSAIDFERQNQRGYLELVAALLLGVIGVVFHKFINKQFPFLAVLLIIALLSVTALKVYQEPDDKELLSEIDEEFFKYSSDKNLILIVLDTFGSEYFQQLTENEPEILGNYNGFVSYTDAISNYPATQGSVPSFLMGEMIPENVKYNQYLRTRVKERGLPKVLANNGYVVSVLSVYRWFRPFFPDRYMYEPQISQNVLTDFYGSQLLDFSLFRVVPHFFKTKIYNEGSWFLSNKKSKTTDVPNTFSERGEALMKMMTENAVVDNKISDPRFKMIHVTIPHPHYRYKADCSKNKSNKGMPLTDLMLQQSRCALKLLNKLLTKYKSLGIYDNSVIVVTSDHGARVFNKRLLTGFPSYFEFDSSGILFMIKGINQKSKFRQVDSPLSLIKLRAALLDESLHDSSYDNLKDDSRLFYAYRNNHKGAPGYLQDAPLFEVKENFKDIKSWILKKFVVNECKKEELPLNMTFKEVGREGYCSIYGFANPEGNLEGSWTQSVDNRIVFKLGKLEDRDQTKNLNLLFSAHINEKQPSLALDVLLNGRLLGAVKIENKNQQEVNFEISADSLLDDDLNVLQFKLPGVKSNLELGIDNNQRKLGLFLRSVMVH